MADFRTIDALLGLSKTPEASFNSMFTAAADFDAAMTTALNVTLPNIEKVFDEKLIGVGNEWASAFENDWASNPAMTLTDRINTSQFAKLLARHLGGTITDSEVAVSSGVYDHVIEMAASSTDPTPKSSTLAGKFGGIDVILAGMVANGLSVQFSDSARPTYSVDLIGSGKFDYMASQTPALVLPAAAAQNYTGTAAAIVVSFDDGTLLDLSSVGRLQGFSLQSSMNADLSDRRPGDSFLTPGDINSGAYVGRAARGDRSLSVTVNVYNNGSKREFLDSLNGTVISNLKFKAVGKKIAATIYSHEVEFTVPKSVIRTVALGDNRGKQILPLTFEFLKSNSESGIWKARIRNATATLA